MPADFTPLDDERRDLGDLFGLPVGFGTRVKTLMARCFGTDNLFGTAATVDAAAVNAGRQPGAVPLLDADGDLSFETIPAADAVEAGAVGIGDATAADTAQYAGQTFPNAITAAGASAAISPFLSAIAASAVSLDNLTTTTYGASNNLRTAFILPRQACVIIMSANGGRGWDAIGDDEIRHPGGESIGIVNNAGDTILRINGGAAGPRLIIYPDGRAVGDRTSNFSTAQTDTPTILAADTLADLSLRTGMLLKGMGAPGEDDRNQPRAVGGGGRAYFGHSQPADLLFAAKDDTPNPITWLTDMPAVHYLSRRHTITSGFTRVSTQGFAFAMRLR